MQAAGFEVAQEVLPRGFVFLGAFTYPEHFAVTVLVDADGDEDGDVFDFAAPGAIEPQAVEVDVGVFSFYRSVAPGFDLAAIFWLSSLTVEGLTRVPQSAWVMSSTRRTDTPAWYISMSASSTLVSRRR